MAHSNNHWSKYGDNCIMCNSETNLTRHHVKKNGRKTGMLYVLCRDCHDTVNEEEIFKNVQRWKSVNENRFLWTTNVGSHIWKMNRPDSDVDKFSVYIVPTKDILNGKNKGRGSHFSSNDSEDRVSHEIGKTIDLLVDGNINFMIGTLSTIVLFKYKNYLDELKEIFIEHGQTKACANSIRGLAIHNYKKYVVGSDTAREYPIIKKCNTINRTLLFGINVLNGNGFIFNPVRDQTPEDVKKMLEEFDKTVESSKLPDKINPEPFREWLLQLRLKELNNEL